MTTVTRQSGFALLELIFAFSIVTVGMFGVLQMYHLGLGKLHATNERAMALEAVQNELETLIAQPFESLEVTTGRPFMTKARAFERLVRAEGVVAIEDSADAPGLKTITVRLSWTGENARRITKELVTMAADGGLQ